MYRLAARLGIWDVRGLYRAISNPQLIEWEAYYLLEPFGEERDDLRAGIISSTVANVFRSKRSKTFAPRDFMPRIDESSSRKTRDQTPGEILAAAEMLNAMLGGKDYRKGETRN